MVATKVTLLINASTRSVGNDVVRLAGFSESYYSTLAIDDPQLKLNWSALAQARAQLLGASAAIVGSRYQNVDPVGASRQYDNVYPSGTTLVGDLPSVSLQWTVRSAGTPNQRSLILRGVPDARVNSGEYAPTAAYNTAMINFFNQLRTNWKFRAIDRTQQPVKIVSIVNGLMTTAQAHGLANGDLVNIMSTKAGTDREVISYEAIVINPITATTATLFLGGRGENVRDSVFGRVRKANIIYPFFSITDDEIVTPTAITRKVGAPFKKFRGRRTARR